MKKNASSGSSLILIVVFLLLVVLFLRYTLRSPRIDRIPESRLSRSINPAEAPKAYEGRRYREHEAEAGRGSPGERSRKPTHGSEYCNTLSIVCTSEYFAGWTAPSSGTCRTQMRRGYPVPDPQCTPGGVNPSVTEQTLRDPDWRTGCVRDCETSETRKHATYAWYGLVSPHDNAGEHQVCELDHLVPLELGGADGLGNLWPQCGPDGAELCRRNFKMKDHVENYLADEVKSGRMPLDSAQRAIAADWTQFLEAAELYCAHGGRCRE